MMAPPTGESKPSMSLMIPTAVCSISRTRSRLSRYIFVFGPLDWSIDLAGVYVDVSWFTLETGALREPGSGGRTGTCLSMAAIGDDSKRLK
jgi:hypothetical protein